MIGYRNTLITRIYSDIGLQRYIKTRIQGYKDTLKTKIQGYKVTLKQGYRDTRKHYNLDIWIQGYINNWDIWIQGYKDIRGTNERIQGYINN